MNLREIAKKGIGNLSKEEHEEYIKECKKFLYNPENIHNCNECPDNIECSGWQGRYPCGQLNCWVQVHCNH